MSESLATHILLFGEEEAQLKQSVRVNKVEVSTTGSSTITIFAATEFGSGTVAGAGSVYAGITSGLTSMVVAAGTVAAGSVAAGTVAEGVTGAVGFAGLGTVAGYVAGITGVLGTAYA